MLLFRRQRRKIITKPTREAEYKLGLFGSLLGLVMSCFYFFCFDYLYSSLQYMTIAIILSLSGVIASIVAYLCLNLVDYQTRKFAIIMAICSIWGLSSVRFFYIIPALLLLSSSFLCFWRKNREIRIIK